MLIPALAAGITSMKKKKKLLKSQARFSETFFFLGCFLHKGIINLAWTMTAEWAPGAL